MPGTPRCQQVRTATEFGGNKTTNLPGRLAILHASGSALTALALSVHRASRHPGNGPVALLSPMGVAKVSRTDVPDPGPQAVFFLPCQLPFLTPTPPRDSALCAA